MEEDNPFEKSKTVDPEVRAYVYSLVTALGGTGVDTDGKYVLGDDALACLRDLKRWLKLYDEKLNRLDVARCLAEANLVNGDLLPILASWQADEVNNTVRARIALAVLELLVPLTWPLETASEMTQNHHRHIPYLQQAQVLYKAGLLGHDTASILRTIVRVGLPSIATPQKERTNRDEGIIKLMLYSIRNIAAINIVPNIPSQGLENEVSRSATIEGFRFQDVFALILTICSNMGEDFDQQDVIVLEILFHLTKGVDAEKLFLTEEQQKVQKTSELKDILSKERSMQRDYAKIAPTRHGRFGTMIWMKGEDERLSVISGQDNLRDGQNTLLKMDKSKKFNKPKQKMKDEHHTIYDFDKTVHLNRQASESLRMFTEEFLDSGFNPLFAHLRKAIAREADRIQELNVRQYFYVVAWFLKAERARRDWQKKAHVKNKVQAGFEPDSYTIVAAVLDQETFILLNRVMQKSFDDKEWQDLNATMRCFTQILLTIQEMALSPLEEDQEIAENIQNRIFYEEITHDRVVGIVKAYKDQGFGYLDASTELAHVFLRMLERYSRENVDLQIRSRRRARRRKEANRAAGTGKEMDGVDDDQRSEDEDAIDTAQVTKERKFDFGRFSAKFTTQKSVDTFTALAKYYRDLSVDQLKRAHRFFYRVAFKQDLAVLLYRVDIISLFYRMIKGPEGLDPHNKMFREWEELVRQVLKKMFKKISERPELVTELLFSKINATLFYLEFGHEKQTSHPMRTTTELEVKGINRTLDDKIAIVVAALDSSKKMYFVSWVRRSLELAVDERKSWEAEALARKEMTEQPNTDASEAQGATDVQIPLPPPFVVKPRDDEDIMEMNRNAKLRLLMTLVGMEKTHSAADVITWSFPSTLSSEQLFATLSILDKHMSNPQTEFDGYEPAALLRRANAIEHKEPQSSTLTGFIDDDTEGTDAGEEFLFPNNLRTRTDHDGSEEVKKRRLIRKRKAEPVDDVVIEERRRAREEAALARRRAIKSELYIHASDDETDEERDRTFFELEALRRQKQAKNVLSALATGQQNVDPKHHKSSAKGTSKSHKRKGQTISEDDDDNNTSDTDSGSILDPEISLSDEEDLTKETPISSQVNESEDDLILEDKILRQDVQHEITSKPAVISANDIEEDSDGDMARMAPRRRLRAGFVVDSDEE